MLPAKRSSWPEAFSSSRRSSGCHNTLAYLAPRSATLYQVDALVHLLATGGPV
jgi:hypothetical protein